MPPPIAAGAPVRRRSSARRNPTQGDQAMTESKGKAFRRLLKDEPYVFTGGVYSPLDAQIAEKVGIKAIYLSGYSVAMANGWPDMGFLTQTEVARIASMVAGAVDVPVIADADDGYGNALSNMRPVWAELSNASREPAIEFAQAMRKTHPELPLSFNYSSSFKWSSDSNPLTFKELGELGYKFIFITLFAAHAGMYATWNALEELAKDQEQAQWRLEKTKAGHPTESHHVMARVAHFQELEKKYIPGTEERIKGSHGFDDKRMH